MANDPDAVTRFCPVCEYDLTGSTGNRCPECGARIPAERPGGGRFRLSGHGRWLLFSAAVGVGCLTAWVAVRTVQGSRLRPPGADLGLYDSMGLLALGVAAAGHLALAVSAVASRRWPMRNRELGRILLVVAGLSILAGLVGALPAAQVPSRHTGPPEPREGFFEFAVYLAAFTCSGWLLLLLRLIAFRTTDAGARTTARPVEEQPAEAHFAVAFARRYARGQLTVCNTGVDRRTTPAIEQAIARAWEEEASRASVAPEKLFNGRLARLVRMQAGDKQLRLELGSTCYRDFLGTNLRNARSVLEQDAGCFADPLGTSAVVVTSDGHIALGRRSNRVVHHAGFVHAFGGMVEPADRDKAETFDLFASMLRELSEELGITGGDVTESMICGMAYDLAIHQPELLFEVSVTLARSELLKRWASSSSREEHVGVEFVHDDPESTAEFLDRIGPIAPVAQAALLIHGRHEWGADWYEQTCYVLYGELPRKGR